MKCHYITVKDLGRVFIPGCMGAAVHGKHKCTCASNGKGTEERIVKLEATVKKLAGKIKAMEKLT